ncbi:hypothetical protein TrVE_jg8106 [Triparma verrucosa]|uniref:Ubiquitin-like domain-containing protein n=2 Tax=Triparma TaxID=722752 RepID=A0A9W7BRF3_9STRA|nr:hypothetical protein TrVE_jg8106 [Triparma verrucosa]GMH92362.1 hypothetical protein TrST_g2900 [Triparma strigata]
MSAAVQPMSIRVKHSTKESSQTFFIPCLRSSSFLSIKQQISEALGQNAITSSPNQSPSNIQLLLKIETGTKELPDLGTISDHMIENDSVMYAAFRKEGGSWEEIGGD